MKRLTSIILTLTLLLSFTFAFAESAPSSSIRYEGPGFDTAADAVTCYMKGLENLDFEQMLSAYAWETLASHYSIEKYIKWIKAYSPASLPRMPAFNDFMETANLHAFRANETRLIYGALETYIMGDEYHHQMTVALTEEEEADAFLQKFDNGKLEQLAGMSDIIFLTPDLVTEGKFSLEMNQKSFKTQTARYGADEVVNVVAAAVVGDGLIVCMPTVARYGDRWYMVSCSSMTSNIMAIEVNRQAFMYMEGKVTDFFR